ncbi:serine hydrolase [Sinorhizobium medicae]|nr:serine hydrolase [Sinorhizobium medicae]MDX0931487.1 serine hydrolase [Sinorhizobium medicae]MDX0993003.1 serine hydrolase [Sinorhizobium medicae]MDX1078853.1 serine hydrolase [Sinorhizobium medicae]
MVGGKRFGIASVARSITSTLLGHAIASKFRARTRGEFHAILSKPVDRFVKDEQPPRSAYNGVPLDRAMRMRSGVIWRENGWHGWFSDNEQFRRRVRGKWETVTEFASKYRGAATGPETPEFNYSALDAAMAAVAAEAMLGNERLTEFLEHGIWRAIGAEAPASCGVDKAETAIGPCCFRATVRDLALFGLFVLNKGRNADGRQIIPSAWFDIATKGHSSIDKIPWDNPSFNPCCPLDYRYF